MSLPRPAACVLVSGLTALALVLSTGCKSGVEKRLAVDPSLELRAAAVYPFGFRWEEPAWRAFALSHRLMAAAGTELPQGLHWFGPSEFKRFRAEDDDVYAATDLLPRLLRYHVGREALVVFRPWAERRVAESQRLVEDTRGAARAQGSAGQTTYVGHVEVVHPSTQKVLAEVVGEVTVDPLEAPDSEVDPTPALTALMERLMREAARALGGVARGEPAPPPLPVALRFVPLAGLEPVDGTAAPDTTDPVARDLAALLLTRFLNPDLSDEAAAKLTRLPPGLLVEGEGVPGLAPGDVILEVAERPAQPQTLARERLLGAPVLLKVRKASGVVVELGLPAAR